MRKLYLVLIISVVLVLVVTPIVTVSIATMPFLGMMDDIKELNEEDKNADSTIETFLNLPTSKAFVEIHPEYSQELTNLGMDFEFYLKADGASLRIIQNQEGYSSTYTCRDSEGLDGTYLQPTQDECSREFFKAIPELGLFHPHSSEYPQIMQ